MRSFILHASAPLVMDFGTMPEGFCCNRDEHRPGNSIDEKPWKSIT